jgi:hypothetical protein
MDLKKHLVKLQGNKEYLPVAARIVAFREAHPAGVISTDLIATEPVAVVRASIHAADGVLLATGYGTSPMAGKGSYAGRGLEKAETAAIGRALAHAGFGTLYALDDDDDADHLADAPIEPPRKEPAPASGWTREQAKKLGDEAHGLGVSAGELLALLNVEKLSDYQPGYMAASANLLKYAASRQPASANGGAK